MKSEQDPFDPTPAREMRETVAAIRHLEEAVLGARWTEGIVLRYGAFYGPGTALASGGEQFELVRRRKFPVVGDGGGVWSFIHVADAAEATVAAVEHGSRGVYNVVDDDPAPVAEWLPALAQALGAKKPMRVPRFVGRAVRRRGRGDDDDRRPRRVEREGQARAGLAPGAPELAAGVRRGMSHELQPVASAIPDRMLAGVPEGRRSLPQRPQVSQPRLPSCLTRCG